MLTLSPECFLHLEGYLHGFKACHQHPFQVEMLSFSHPCLWTLCWQVLHAGNSVEDVFVSPRFAWSFIFEFWSCWTCQYGFISHFFKNWDPLVLCLRLLWVYQGYSLSSSLTVTILSNFVVYMNYLEHSCLSVPWHLCSKVQYQAWYPRHCIFLFLSALLLFLTDTQFL